MPTFEEPPQHPRNGIARDLDQQIHLAFHLGFNRIVRIAAELSDEITFAIDDGDTAKVEALNPWLIHLKEWIEKNQKLHTKMRAAGLGD